MTKENFEDRLMPGDGNAEGSPPGEWGGRGLANGIIFFEDVLGYDPVSRQLDKVLKKGTERQAMRYLLAALWTPAMENMKCEIAKNQVREAMEWRALHLGQLGWCEPVIDFLLIRYPEIKAEAEAGTFPIGRKFLSCRAGIDANQPAHADRWHVFKVEEGVWCVFYA